MSGYIKKVKYQRPVPEDVSWIFHQVPPYDATLSAASKIHDTYIPAKIKRLDVTRQLTEVERSQVVPVTLTLENTVPGASQLNPGYVMPRGKSFVRQYHNPYIDDLGWLKQALPFVAFDTRLFPAIDMQMQSFRVKRASRTTNASRTRINYGSTEPVSLSQMASAYMQLVNSYRSVAGKKYSPQHLDPYDAFAYLTVTLPSSVLFIPGMYDLIRSSTFTPKPNLAKRGYELFWNTVPRMFGLVVEDESITVASMAQLANSFRMLSRARLDKRIHIDDTFNAAITYQEVFQAVIGRTPALYQASQMFWNYARKRNPELLNNFLDMGAWFYIPTIFDAAFMPGIGIDSFVMPPGKRMDVRKLDTPFDAWMSFEADFLVGLYASSLVSSMESFRVRERTRTHDPFRHETIHDLSWLHDVLTLIDTPFLRPRAHWREIAAAVHRRKHRRRK